MIRVAIPEYRTSKQSIAMWEFLIRIPATDRLWFDGDTIEFKYEEDVTAFKLTFGL